MNDHRFIAYLIGFSSTVMSIHRDHKYCGYIKLDPVKGAVGTNGRKGAYVLHIDDHPLDRARFLRSADAVDALNEVQR